MEKINFTENTVVITVDGKDYKVVVGDNVVKVDGKSFNVSLREEGAAAAAAPVASSGGVETPVEAPVAGTVLKFVRANGDSVEKDETVLIMESMKMELEVKSKSAGVLTFKVAASEAVAAGQVLAVVA